MILWRLVLLSCIGFFGLVGNTLAIIVLVKHPDVLGESQRLIINQSIIDALAALILLLSRGNIEVAMGVKIDYTDNWFYNILCKTWGADSFLWGLMLTSTYNLVLLTLDRCLKLTFPFWYRKHIKPTILNFFMTLVWLFGNMFEHLHWLQANEINLTDHTCEESESAFSGAQYYITGIISLNVELFLPIVCLIVFYGLILRVLRKQQKVMQIIKSGKESQQVTATSSTAVIEEEPRSLHKKKIPQDIGRNIGNTVPTNSLQTKYKVSEIKVIKTLSMVCIGFFICYLQMLMLFLLFPVLNMDDLGFWFHGTNLAAFMNCAINPVISVGRHDMLRKHFLQRIYFWKSQ